MSKFHFFLFFIISCKWVEKIEASKTDADMFFHISIPQLAHCHPVPLLCARCHPGTDSAMERSGSRPRLIFHITVFSALFSCHACAHHPGLDACMAFSGAHRLTSYWSRQFSCWQASGRQLAAFLFYITTTSSSKFLGLPSGFKTICEPAHGLLRSSLLFFAFP